MLRDKEKYSYSVFINPYNGKVLKVRNNKRDFFSVTLDLHRTLLIPYGHDLVRWSTVAFFIIIVSGLVIWWPRNKRATKQGFTIKLRALPKRLNYDLHRVLGFYASWAILLTVFTDLMFAFDSLLILPINSRAAKVPLYKRNHRLAIQLYLAMQMR